MAKLPSPRPLSIKLISLLFGIWAVQFIVKIAQTDPDTHHHVLFSVGVSGGLGLGVQVVYVLLYCYLAYGLWRVSDTARRVGIGYCVFDLVNLFSSWLIMFLRFGGNVVGPIFGSAWLLDTAMTVRHVMIIWFLFTRKSAFVTPRIPAPTSTNP